MKKLVFTFIVLTPSLLACKKKDADQNSSLRKVRYEITGNFTGKFDVVYSDNISGTTRVTNVALPWSKEVTYDSRVLSIGVGAQASTTGVPSQTATIKIYRDESMVKTGSATAGSLGEMVLPTVAYSF